MTIIEALTCEARERFRGELLVAESMGEVKEKVLRWKEHMEARGLKINTWVVLLFWKEECANEVKCDMCEGCNGVWK